MSSVKTPRSSAKSATAASTTIGKVPHRALVDALAARLRQSPASPDTPLVVINHISPTKSVHVLVIWSKWKDLTIPQRARVIADAFAAAFPASDSVVRLPLG